MSTRILVIEDKPANMELMAYLLAAYGHTVLQSTDGVDGLETAIRELPDLILCDVQLPRLDGYGVVRELKAHPTLRWIPVVAVTAQAMVGDREKLLSCGFDAYIDKPIEPELFVAQIENLLSMDKRSDGVVAATVSTAAGPLAVRTRSARILVVDDSEVNAELIRSTLLPFGYQLTLASSVRQALELADAMAFDLILSDLHMPVDDGFVLLRALKADARLDSIPFMFLSASFSDASDRELGLQLGATIFINRPIEPMHLLGHIDTCLAQREQK